jgi:rhamnose transport system substrate-binding protein
MLLVVVGLHAKACGSVDAKGHGPLRLGRRLAGRIRFRYNRWVFRPLYAIAAVLTLCLCGCSSGGGKASDASGGGTKLKIVFIPKSSGNSYFDEIDRGFKEAAQKFNLEYTMVAPATGEATSQVPMLTDQIQRGVDIIAISPNSPDALNSVLDQAKAKGITVITVDADLVGNESHRDAAVLATDFQDVGQNQLEVLGSLIGYQGDIAILSATTDAPNQNAWIAVMKKTLTEPKYAKMKLVDTVYGDDEPQKSTTECDGLIAKHATLAGIIAPTSVGMAAAAQVVDRDGIFPGGPHATGKGLQLTGLSTPNQLKKFIKNGSVTRFQLWSPYNEGVLAAYLGQQIHLKKITPKMGLQVDVPDLGKREFSAKLEVIGGPMLTFDKSNIDKFDF